MAPEGARGGASSRFGPVLAEFLSVARLMFVRGAGLVATFLMGVLIARIYGTSTNGLFQVGVAYLGVVATVARLGQDQLALRRMAELKAVEDGPRADREMQSALRLAAPVSIAAALGFAAFPFFAWSNADAPFLAAFAIALVPIAILSIVTEGLRGWQSVLSSMLWQGAFLPVLFTLALLATLLFGSVPAPWLPVIYGACAVSALSGALVTWRRTVPMALGPTDDAMGALSWRTQLRNGRHFWLLAVLLSVAGWLDLLMLYSVADAREVGVFFAVVRTGTLIATALNVAAAGVVARLALLYASRRLGEFATEMRRYSLAFLAAAALAALLFLVFAEPIMGVWGAEVLPHATEFTIYLAIQLAQAGFILIQLVAPVIGLERRLIAVQLVITPLKATAIYVGYEAAGLLGVVLAVGAAMLGAAVWTALLFVGKLRRDGVGLRVLVLGG